MKRPLRVLFLTRYPVEGASSRYRVHQYLPSLRDAGVDCDVQSFMDSHLYGLSFAPGHVVRKLWLTLLATCRRLRAVARHRNYDIVYMQRELFPFGPPWAERWMSRRGTRLVFDYDDALFIKKPSRYNPLATLFRAPGKVLELFRIVDCVVAGNDWLRDQALANGARRAETVEVAEDTMRMRARSRVQGAPATIGWLGSTSTVKYLRLIEPVLRDLAQSHPELRFELVGGGDFRMDGVPWAHVDWSLDREPESLARFDIGLMPLPMEDWAKGKSGGKARTYMAAGVVPVCSAIGYNLELVDQGRTGMLCETDADWGEALEALVADPAMRWRMGEAARAEVARRFSIAGQARRLREVLESVAGAEAA